MESRKSAMAKLPIASKESMKKALISIPRSIQKTALLVKSFFKLKSTLYISDASVDSAIIYATINTRGLHKQWSTRLYRF
jgi:hypothetical protein